MRDILSVDNPTNTNRLYGGKPVLPGGDSRQVLPVIEGGTRADVIIALSYQVTTLWKYTEVIRLTVNMRFCNLAF